LYTNTTGADNSAFGFTALVLNTTGSSNTALGVQALRSNTTASNNTAVGYQAGYSNLTGPSSVYVGAKAGYADTSGYNVYIGNNSGVAATGTTNTFIGESSGSGVTTGAKNTIIGRYSGSAAPISATGSNYIVLSDGDGNVRQTIDSSGNVGIGTTSPSSILNVKSSAPIFRLETTGAVTSTGTAYNAIRDSSGSDVFTNGFLGLANCYQFGTTFANGFIRFLTGTATEAMRIDSSGNVGIGTSSPSTYQDSQGKVLVTGSSPNWATIQSRGDGPSGAGNLVSYGGSYSTNPINGARIGLAASGGSGQQGQILFYTKALDDNTTQPLERMRVDQSGNVGIGTTTLNGKLNVLTATDSKLIFNDGSTTGNVRLEAVNNAYSAYKPLETNGSIQIFATGATERMRIDSNGRIQVNGTTVVDSARISVSADGANSTGVSIKALSTSCTLSTYWNTSNTTVGSITTNGTTVAYNITSDYRLKQDVVPMTGALAKVALLKPVTYKWKSDGSDAEGFIAHELAEVCPAAVHGAKDAVDADGKPKYQGIDVSFLVATLTAAIQEQQVLITSLTTRIATLESK
jgi:hypothetical protein